MASESLHQNKMRTASAEYVGALLDEERRLVLVSVDPEHPWEAFRQLRRQMRRERRASTSSISLFTAAAPFNQNADIIPLDSRRRAG
jgi:hypothetical protein